MIVLDTSGVLAAIDGSQPRHDEACEVLAHDDGPLVMSPLVLAEVDYLLASKVGIDAELAFLAEVARGAYVLASWSSADVATAAGVIAKDRDRAIGLADASVAVLAERYGTTRVLTLDERHFRVLRTAAGAPFVLLPADAPRERSAD